MFEDNELLPLFMQVAQWIKDEILKENFREEEQVPSINQFANLYKMNPATANKGLKLLVNEGILYKKRGIGMFVASGAKEMIQKQAKEKFQKETVKEFWQEAKKLGITTEELMSMLQEEEKNNEHNRM